MNNIFPRTTLWLALLLTSVSAPAATKDQIVPHHPRLLHRGESGWGRNVVGSFAWRIMKDQSGTPPPPIAPGTDSLY